MRVFLSFTLAMKKQLSAAVTLEVQVPVAFASLESENHGESLRLQCSSGIA